MRPDLAALTPETLAELTNRGLVKRAAREVDRAAPALTEDADGTVRATFDDGVVTTLPTGGLEAGRCTCGAVGVCRHIVALALTYQRTAVSPGPVAASRGPAADGSVAARIVDAPGHPEVDGVAPVPPADEGWSPGEFTDEQLSARIGARMMTAARRAERIGYVARVHRQRPGDPVPSVDLPTATVRFLVPGDLAFARTDAVAGARDDVIALAVWAFRAADRRPDASVGGPAGLVVQVGGSTGGTPAPAGRAELGRARDLAGLVLLDGAVHIGAGIAADVAAVRRDLEAARLRWPLLAVEDLDGQLTAYRERSARYRPELLADHLAEVHARHRSVTGSGASLHSRVLGTEEASETPLRRARFDGLGARVSAVGADRVVTVFVAHADSATVLVLRRSWETGDAGPQLAARRIGGVALGALAAGTVVTESAVRSASRTLRLGVRRLSRTEALTSRGSWRDLPGRLVAADLAALADELDALPPRPVRPRVEAELVRVVPIAEVRSMRYAPGSQQLDAVITDAHGHTAVISAVHTASAPGRLDSMAAALSGAPRFVAGAVRRSRGGVVIDPIGFVTGDQVVVPDLAAPTPGADPDDQAPGSADPLSAAIDEAAGLLAEIAHRGLRHLPATVAGRLRTNADRLTAVGMRRAASDLARLADRLGPDPGETALEAWADAYLRLSLAADLR